VVKNLVLQPAGDMMRRSIPAVLIVISLVASISGCKQQPANPLTESMFKVAVEKQFGLAKQRIDSIQVASLFGPEDAAQITVEQNESGNAGELYWAVLKDRIDPNAEATQKLLNQTSPIVQLFEFAEKNGVAIEPKSLDAVKKEAEEAAALPELANFESGARRKYSRLVGEVIPVPDNVLNQILVPLSVLKGYMAALMTKGLLRETAGKKAEAEAAMKTIVAVGHHFSQDPSYTHYFTGQVIMKFGCSGLKSFYKRNGDAAKQQTVEQFEKGLDEQAARLTQLAARDETGKNFNILKTLGYLDEGVDALTRIAADEKVPVAFRAGAIENILSGYLRRYMMVEQSGRPPETSEYAPPSEARLKSLEQLSTVPDKTLSQMASKSRQILTKMKDLNSGERAKYWHELSAAKS
jgi:hypothetical protein